jgi:YrbI family 3-deoxy-D-manno-octulosonate 8-phosphate phosphatase
VADLDIIAIIPARGGSKRIPSKNLISLRGLPLVAHSIRHARQSKMVRSVYVSTDSSDIADLAKREGAEVIIRPPELATDVASSESALLHVLDERQKSGLRDPDLVVFLQCTSPVRGKDDIDNAVSRLIETNADSVFSGSRNDRLIWGLRGGSPHSINYDYRTRKREQDMEIQFKENGSIYVFRPAVLRAESNRLGGRIEIYEMDYWASFQLDHAGHMEVLELALGMPRYATHPSWPARVELVVFDFDGVMTDNRVNVSETGLESVVCHRGDGFGLDRLRAAGVPMLVLSTEKNPVVAARCKKLKLEMSQGHDDKVAALRDLLTRRDIDPANVIFVGNDDNDLGSMEFVGFAVAVADSSPRVLAAADLVLAQKGGRGAVREFADRFLEQYSSARSQL